MRWNSCVLFFFLVIPCLLLEKCGLTYKHASWVNSLDEGAATADHDTVFLFNHMLSWSGMCFSFPWHGRISIFSSCSQMHTFFWHFFSKLLLALRVIWSVLSAQFDPDPVRGVLSWSKSHHVFVSIMSASFDGKYIWLLCLRVLLLGMNTSEVRFSSSEKNNNQFTIKWRSHHCCPQVLLLPQAAPSFPYLNNRTTSIDGSTPIAETCRKEKCIKRWCIVIETNDSLFGIN